MTTTDHQARCTCDRIREHSDSDAQAYASGHLVEVERNVSLWTTTYRCPVLRILWLEDWPWAEMHGGGPRRLRQFDLVRRALRSELNNVVALIGDDVGALSAVESRLIEVHGDRAYLCLSNAINDSMPPSCGGAAIGTRDNPQLHGPMVPELIHAMKGINQFVDLSASEEDGKWLLQKYVTQG